MGLTAPVGIHNLRLLPAQALLVSPAKDHAGYCGAGCLQADTPSPGPNLVRHCRADKRRISKARKIRVQRSTPGDPRDWLQDWLEKPGWLPDRQHAHPDDPISASTALGNSLRLPVRPADLPPSRGPCSGWSVTNRFELMAQIADADSVHPPMDAADWANKDRLPTPRTGRGKLPQRGVPTGPVASGSTEGAIPSAFEQASYPRRRSW